MGYSRSDTAFFHDKATHHVIEDIADSDGLVIFAGAGVTIDRTDLTWRGLLLGLLRRVPASDEEREAVIQYSGQRSELHLASIVRSLYERTGPGWNRRMIEDAHALLYSERTWRGGRYANAIAQLVLAVRESGRKVCIVTTNQDEFIEIAILEACRRSGVQEEVRTLSLEHKESVGEPRLVDGQKVRPTATGERIPVVHVHGAIKKDPRKDSKIGSIVLGERDFFVWETDVAELLVPLFESANVLIVGAGLEDPNLMRALHKVKQRRKETTDGSHPKRKVWSVTTKGSLVSGAISEPAVKAAKVGLSKRLGEFDVVPVLPDMYSQAHQLLLEVASEIAHRSETCKYSSADADYRYGRRLRSWWQAWDELTRAPRAGVSATSDARQLSTQNDHHGSLVLAEDMAREVLSSVPGYEKTDRIKVEVWLRWDPSESNRRLRLWATSLGPWASAAGYKDAEISTDSGMAAVRAFCSGSAELLSVTGDRWQRYLAVPVEVQAEGGSSVIVGVATVATSNPSLLAWKEVSPMRRLVFELPLWVKETIIAGPFEVAQPGLPVD
ncbi:MAG: SIR2 family protein [Actinobacteria bacterium]|nr:SIR2 family protein [Actinomycetota bacterium]